VPERVDSSSNPAPVIPALPPLFEQVGITHVMRIFTQGGSKMLQRCSGGLPSFNVLKNK
jgi:hypothetical protein